MLLQCDQSRPVYCSCELPGTCEMSPSQCLFPVCMCAGLSVPAEIHHQLFGLPGVELEVILLVAVHKALNKYFVGSVVPVPDEADDSRVIKNVCRWLWVDWW